MATAVYGKKTLNGKLQFLTHCLIDNWYEERLAQQQEYRDQPEKRIKRPYEPAINCLTASGIPEPLERINRIPKHDSTQVILSDGFNVKQSTNKDEIKHPSCNAIKEKTILKMIHRYNLADLNLSDRTAGQPKETRFGNTKFAPMQAGFSTTNTASFGVPKQANVSQQVERFTYTQK